MNDLRSSRRIRLIITSLMVITLAISVTTIYAAYRVNRLVTLEDEPILQTYLYGEGTSFRCSAPTHIRKAPRSGGISI
jgi:hypothetical protein